MADLPHIPILRFGKAYTSLDVTTLEHHRTGEALAEMSIANAGLLRRDLLAIKNAKAALDAMTVAQLVDITKRASESFMHDDLPLGLDNAGPTLSPDRYVEVLSATSGLPYTLCRSNMGKIHTAMSGVDTILKGLTRGLDLSVLDTGIGEQAGSPVAYAPTTDALGVVLPSTSPGVNSIWLPAIAMKMPVVLKPGREEPWTPMRVIAALVKCGCPAEAFGFYPAGHDGADAIMRRCERAIIFGGDATLEPYRDNPAVNCHGTGRSKVLIAEDRIDNWPELLDLLVASVAANGGRSCINTSTIIVSRHGDAIADALAQRLAAITPKACDDPDAQLSAFANPAFAQMMNDAIDAGLEQPGATDVTATYRTGPRMTTLDGATYLEPTVVRCDDFDHPLANTEYLFPFVAIVEMPQADMLSRIGPSLVVTGVTDDTAFRRDLLQCPFIDRLNLGAIPTSRVEWDQPHEGNLFEFLYRRRAIQQLVTA